MKTRLQLQGELVKQDANAPRVYKNVFDVFRKTWRNEGVRGLQRGLMPAYGYQVGFGYHLIKDNVFDDLSLDSAEWFAIG